MKQRITIFVEIDPDAKPEPSETQVIIRPKVEGDIEWSAFRITVSPDDLATGAPSGPEALKTTLVHELGHVVGAVLKTPAHMADPRTTHGRSGDASGIVASEREAWEIGALIYPQLDWLEADRNLATYDNPDSRHEWEQKIALARLFN